MGSALVGSVWKRFVADMLGEHTARPYLDTVISHAAAVGTLVAAYMVPPGVGDRGWSPLMTLEGGVHAALLLIRLGDEREGLRHSLHTVDRLELVRDVRPGSTVVYELARLAAAERGEALGDNLHAYALTATVGGGVALRGKVTFKTKHRVGTGS